MKYTIRNWSSELDSTEKLCLINKNQLFRLNIFIRYSLIYNIFVIIIINLKFQLPGEFVLVFRNSV